MSSRTIREYITEVNNRYSKGVKSQDSRLSNRLIYSKLREIRAMIISQKSDKKQIISSDCYQLLSGVEMQITTTSMLPGISIGNPILITTNDLPRFIYDNDRPLIQFVSNIEGSKVYNKTTFQTIKNAIGRKFTGNDANYFTINSSLYINHPQHPKVIIIRAIFDDPITAALYPVYGECITDCTSYLDFPFAIDEDTGNTVIELVTEKLLSIFDNKQEDRLNDEQDNVESRPQRQQ